MGSVQVLLYLCCKHSDEETPTHLKYSRGDFRANMKRPCWVRSIEGFHQGLLFLHGLGSLDLLAIEQGLDLLAQGLCARKIEGLVGLPFAYHFRMDLSQGEHENKDGQQQVIQKNGKKGIHIENQITHF